MVGHEYDLLARVQCRMYAERCWWGIYVNIFFHVISFYTDDNPLSKYLTHIPQDCT